jgi:hypothetical protein
MFIVVFIKIKNKSVMYVACSTGIQLVIILVQVSVKTV